MMLRLDKIVAATTGVFWFAGLTENLILNSVVDAGNLNLDGSSKELLRWHLRLGHAGMSWLQTLMEPKRPRSDKSKSIREISSFRVSVLPTEHASTRVCEHPMCFACKTARATRRGSGT